MKNTKKSFAFSLLSLFLCIVMLVGTTFAWFTDSVTSEKNHIAAGNLDIEVYHTSGKQTAEEKIDGQTDLFNDVILWEPGAVSYENFTVRNEGDLAARFVLSLIDSRMNESVSSRKDLFGFIKVAVVDGGFSGNRAEAQALNNYTDFRTFQLKGTLEGKNDSDTDEHTYGIVLYWKPSANDNEMNMNNGKLTTTGEDLYLSFGINVTATQYDSEIDSFDNTYDADALYTFCPPYITTENTLTNSGTSDFRFSSNGGGDDRLYADAHKAFFTDPAGLTYHVKTSTKVDDPTVKKCDYKVGISDNLFTYKIDTTDYSADSVTYDISFYYTFVNESGTPCYEINEFYWGVPNRIDIGGGLKNLTVTHTVNGVSTSMTKLNNPKPDDWYSFDNLGWWFNSGAGDGTYYYDSEDGYLYFYTSTFGSFTIDYEVPDGYVARIGNQGYTNLSYALRQAKSGETVTLLKDVTLSDTVRICGIKNNINLNLNGHTIECTHTSYPTLCLHSYRKIGKIYGGTIKGATPILLEDSSFYESTIDEIKDCTLVCTQDSGCAVSVMCGYLNNITNVKVEGKCDKVLDIIEAQDTVTINGLTSTAEVKSGYWLYASDWSGVEVENADIKFGNMKKVNDSSISVTGGKYPANPTAFLASGYKATESEGVWTVSHK